MADGLFGGGGAAFGIYPQMGGRRTMQDPQASADIPADVLRGRIAGLLGAIPDLFNLKRSLLPAEAVQALESYGKIAPEVPYGSEYYLQNLPLPPTSQAGQVANQLGSFVPLNPAPIARAVGKVGNVALSELARGMYGNEGSLANVIPSSMKPMMAVEPSLSMPKPQAPVSDIGFYSATEQAAMNLPRNKGTGQSFLNDLMKTPDVKKDELSWTGLDDFLANKPNVTKQEVQDFISQNKVDVQERQLGEKIAEDPIGIAKRKAVFDKYEPQIQALDQEMQQYETNIINARNLASKNYAEANAGLNRENLFGSQPIPTTEDWNRYYLANAEMERVNKIPLNLNEFRKRSNALHDARDAEANAAYVVPEPVPTEYSRWQLPGGENYREILLTLPFKEPAMPKGYQVTSMQYDDGTVKYFAETPTSRSQGFRTQEEAQEQLSKTANNLKGFRENLESYKSSHFNEPNILAHMRVNDRVDAEGKKMLLIEEVQSDWHQAGREQGYKKNESQIAAENQRLKKEHDARVAEQSQLLNEEFKAIKQQMRSLPNQNTEQVLSLKTREKDILNELKTLTESDAPLAKNTGVPDAPFKDTWYQLALKRIMKYASDNGYERVGLTTGKQQIDRFSNEMRQNVDEITFQTGLKLTPSETAELQALRQQQTYMTGTERARYEYLSSNEGEYVGKDETKIRAFKGSKPTFSGTVKGGKFIDGQAEGKTVEEVLGKSMAKQIAEKQTGVLKGDNLTVGGEGMKKYYDEIYPKFLEKYGKKWDASVGETKVRTNEVPYVDYVVTNTPFSDFTVVGVKPDGSKTIINQNANSIEEAQKLAIRYKDKNLKSGEPIRYIDITPKMKESVGKGQPLFTAIPAGTLGLGALDYSDPFGNTIGESIR